MTDHQTYLYIERGNEVVLRCECGHETPWCCSYYEARREHCKHIPWSDLPQFPREPIKPIGPIEAVILRLLLEQQARLFGPLPDDPFNPGDWRNE